jgi:hypothetical protein
MEMTDVEKFETKIGFLTYEEIKQKLKIDNHFLSKIPTKLCNDKSLVLLAVKLNGYQLQYASKELKNDKEIVLAATTERGHSLEYASPQLRNQPEIVLHSMKENGDSMRLASKELKNDPIFAMEAVKINGKSIVYFSHRIRYDKEIVFEALKEHGSLLYVNLLFRSDWKISMHAVKQHPSEIRHVDSSLTNNKNWIIQTIQMARSSSFIDYIEDFRMKDDCEVEWFRKLYFKSIQSLPHDLNFHFEN